MVNDDPLYIHNIYALGDSLECKPFIDHIDTDFFEPRVSHMLLEDLHTALHSNVHATNGTYCHESSRLAWLEWLPKLGVVDAWWQ